MKFLLFLITFSIWSCLRIGAFASDADWTAVSSDATKVNLENNAIDIQHTDGGLRISVPGRNSIDFERDADIRILGDSLVVLEKYASNEDRLSLFHVDKTTGLVRYLVMGHSESGFIHRHFEFEKDCTVLESLWAKPGSDTTVERRFQMRVVENAMTICLLP